MIMIILAVAQAVTASPTESAKFSVDPTTITLIGGMIVTIIGTIVTGVISIITAMRVSHVSTQQSVTANQLVSVAKDTEAIKGHVNSEKTAANGREATLQQENRLLREMLSDKASQIAAMTPSTAPPVVVAPIAPIVPRQGRSTDPQIPIPVEVVNGPLVSTSSEKK